jgi:hypothetical protein
MGGSVTRPATFVLIGALLAACSSAVPCDGPRDCPPTQRCVNHGCADPDGTPGALGEACRTNADCPGGLSCTSQGYPGGFCSASCTDSSTCGAGACTAIGAAQLCAATCTADAQCRQQYGCCPTLGNVCVPLAACTPAACRRPVKPSALDPAQVQQFGTKKVGDVVSFEVPPNTGSVTIVQQAQIATLTVVYQNTLIDNSAVPLTITKPDGGLAYDDLDAGAGAVSSPDGGIDPSGEYAFYGGGTPSTAAFTIPNTTASLDEGVPQGSWKFVVNDYANECTFVQGCNDGGTAENTYEVSVLTRPAPAGFNLAVDFYIAADMNTLAGAPLTASNALTDPAVIRMVQSFKDLMSNAAITANVTFRDLSATDRARFGTNISAQDTGPCAELSQLFTLSEQHPGNTMNLFLVESLRSSDVGGQTIVGIDGTIPGPSSMNGTVASGAVVSAADLFSGSCGGGLNFGACGADRVAYVAVHESGHFLGLFHTTEQEGADFDPLTDTAKCPCTACADPGARVRCGSNSPPLVRADQCVSLPACGGGDNLMFWLLSPGFSLGTLTAQQAQVMRLNPLVQ